MEKRFILNDLKVVKIPKQYYGIILEYNIYIIGILLSFRNTTYGNKQQIPSVEITVTLLNTSVHWTVFVVVLDRL